MAENQTDLLKIEVNSAHYDAEAAIVWCFDARFRPMYDTLVAERGYLNPDPVKIPGGGSEIIFGEASVKKWILDALIASMDLHHTHHIVIMMHEDCGKLKQLQKESGLSWHDFLEKNLQAAYEIVDSYCNSHPSAEACKQYWASKGKLVEKITVEIGMAHMKGLSPVTVPIMDAVNA